GRGGNLVHTVPPAGVAPLPDVLIPQVNTARGNGSYPSMTVPHHRKRSTYHYNSLDQVVYQQTPDGGATEYFYDAAGRLVFSQTERQRYGGAGDMTYILYDPQGRVMETG